MSFRDRVRLITMEALGLIWEQVHSSCDNMQIFLSNFEDIVIPFSLILVSCYKIHWSLRGCIQIPICLPSGFSWILPRMFLSSLALIRSSECLHQPFFCPRQCCHRHLLQRQPSSWKSQKWSHIQSPSACNVIIT
jgi:hypothetical protein